MFGQMNVSQVPVGRLPVGQSVFGPVTWRRVDHHSLKLPVVLKDAKNVEKLYNIFGWQGFKVWALDVEGTCLL